MTDPTLLITIDRTSLSLSPLVLSGSEDGNDLGVTSYQAPALQARIGYAPDSANIDGSEAISAAWQQSLMSFNYVADRAADETESRASYAEVVAALAQFEYLVTTVENGAPAQIWTANRGSIAPPQRSYGDMVSGQPVYAITIPVYPIPGA